MAVKKRPKEQPSKTKRVTGTLAGVTGTFAGNQNRHWISIGIRVEIGKPTMALEMEDFSLNFSALPPGTSWKGSVHGGLRSAERSTAIVAVVPL